MDGIMKRKLPIIPTESLEKRILTLRGEKVILDLDLAEVYGVTTKALNQAVKRNAERFPADFARLGVFLKMHALDNAVGFQQLPHSIRAASDHRAIIAHADDYIFA